MANTGDAEERFSVSLVTPYYEPQRPGDGVPEGAAITPEGTPRVGAPGSVIGDLFSLSTALLASCSTAGAGDHGYEPTVQRFDVRLPAHATSTLHAAYEAGLPLWPDLDLRLRFEVGRRLMSGQLGTLAKSQVVRPPQPMIAGRVAVHITFRTTPRSGRGLGSTPRAIARGRRIVIAGATNPPIAGQRVELRWARIGSSGRVVARGRATRPVVNAKGRFRGRWTPPRAGKYELWARYKTQLAGVRSDDTCPRIVRVRRF